MKTTGNLGLKKPEGTDIVDINDLNGNMDILDTAVKATQDHAADTVKHITATERSTWNAKASTAVATTAAAGLMAAADKVLLNNNTGYGTTAGTATAYTVTLSPVPTLAPGMKFSFKAHVASGTNPTLNPNGLGAKPIKKPNGNAAVLALNGVYTVVYDGANFILQGEGGGIDLNGTNAVPAHVLAGETFYSSGSTNMQTGTMPSYSGMAVAGVLASPGIGRASATIPSAGYYDTWSEISLYDDDFVETNIKAGVNIFGVTGEYTADATATAADIASNKSAYVNGQKIWGTFTTADADAVAADIKAGKTAYVNNIKITGTASNAITESLFDGVYADEIGYTLDIECFLFVGEAYKVAGSSDQFYFDLDTTLGRRIINLFPQQSVADILTGFYCNRDGFSVYGSNSSRSHFYNFYQPWGYQVRTISWSYGDEASIQGRLYSRR